MKLFYQSQASDQPLKLTSIMRFKAPELTNRNSTSFTLSKISIEDTGTISQEINPVKDTQKAAFRKFRKEAK